MKSPNPAKLAANIIGSICCATMFLLLIIAYVPEFHPEAYSRFRRTGLIMVVPMIAAIGFISSIGWLWWEHKLEEKRRSEDTN